MNLLAMFKQSIKIKRDLDCHQSQERQMIIQENLMQLNFKSLFYNSDHLTQQKKRFWSFKSKEVRIEKRIQQDSFYDSVR